MTIVSERKTRVQGGVTLVLEGRLDSANAQELEDILLGEIESAAAGDNLVLDFSRVTFISSLGLRALLKARKQLLAIQGNLQLIGARDQVSGVLRMAHIGL
jgi:anti-anti-sigma factor